MLSRRNFILLGLAFTITTGDSYARGSACRRARRRTRGQAKRLANNSAVRFANANLEGGVDELNRNLYIARCGYYDKYTYYYKREAISHAEQGSCGGVYVWDIWNGESVSSYCAIPSVEELERRKVAAEAKRRRLAELDKRPSLSCITDACKRIDTAIRGTQ